MNPADALAQVTPGMDRGDTVPRALGQIDDLDAVAAWCDVIDGTTEESPGAPYSMRWITRALTHATGVKVSIASVTKHRQDRCRALRARFGVPAATDT